MNRVYHWNGQVIEHNERYNSLIDVNDHEAWIPAIICDGIRYMSAFRISKIVVNDQHEIVCENPL